MTGKGLSSSVMHMPIAAVRQHPVIGRCISATLLLASVALVAASQSPQSPQSSAPAQSQPMPTFRTGTSAVVVDLRVVDHDGKFIDNLTKGEFRIFEDDKEQTVSTFSLINIPIEATRERLVTKSRVQSDVASNSGTAEGRLYLIVLDDAPKAFIDPTTGHCAPAPDGFQSHPLRSPTVRAIAREFVERHLADADQAALVTISSRADMTREFTHNAQRLLEGIDRFEGNSGSPSVECRLGTTLASFATWLSQIGGRRKAIIFVTENVRLLLEDAAEMRDELQRLLAAAALQM